MAGLYQFNSAIGAESGLEMLERESPYYGGPISSWADTFVPAGPIARYYGRPVYDYVQVDALQQLERIRSSMTAGEFAVRVDMILNPQLFKKEPQEQQTPKPKKSTPRTKRQKGVAMTLAEMVKDTAEAYSSTVLRKLRQRRRDFDSPMTMHTLAAVKTQDGRYYLNDLLNEQWQGRTLESYLTTRDVEEVVIGGGIHAAIYCANRVALGYARPLVIERADHLGGSFACSEGAAFRLNSRNRPGPLGLPGDGRGLNVLPGCPIQPSLISQDEYQTNNDLALAVRMAFVDNAKVLLGAEMTGLVFANDYDPDAYGAPFFAVEDRPVAVEVKWRDQPHTINCKRVIDARGLGDQMAQPLESDNVMTFQSFMRMQDKEYPLRGLKRVAVIGGGDSAKTAIEALVGIGPGDHMSVPELDFVERVDWYARGVQVTCDTWKAVTRGRYRGIGSYLPRTNEEAAQYKSRLNVYQKTATPMQGMNCAYIDERPYDLVIMCTGYTLKLLNGNFNNFGYLLTNGQVTSSDIDDEELPGKMAFGRRAAEGPVYRVGPCANIPYSSVEGNKSYALIADNRTAIFRLAGRTAALAGVLSGKVTGTRRPLDRSKAFSAA